MFIEQIKKQMYSGELGIPYANKSYTNEKRQMNPSAGGRMDFYYTGQMFKQMYIENSVSGYNFESKPTYTDKLQSDYPQMWIYTKSSINTLKEEILFKFRII